MSNKVGWKEVRVKLNRMSDRDLIGLVGDLYKLNKENESYLKAKFFDDKETYQKYTNKIIAHNKGLDFITTNRFL